MLNLYTKAQTALESLKNEEGQDMIEYALLAALIGVVVAAALPALATAITGLFGTIEGLL
jgi:pilus assembly protein Flp/PilA